MRFNNLFMASAAPLAAAAATTTPEILPTLSRNLPFQTFTPPPGPKSTTLLPILIDLPYLNIPITDLPWYGHIETIDHAANNTVYNIELTGVVGNVQFTLGGKEGKEFTMDAHGGGQAACVLDWEEGDDAECRLVGGGTVTWDEEVVTKTGLRGRYASVTLTGGLEFLEEEETGRVTGTPSPLPTGDAQEEEEGEEEGNEEGDDEGAAVGLGAVVGARVACLGLVVALALM